MEEPIIVELPDGSEAEFPAGTSMATIKSAMQKRFPQQTASPAPSDPSVSMGEYTTGGEQVAPPASRADRSLYDIPAEAASNVIPSSIRMGKGLYGAATNPMQTLAGVGNVAAGLLTTGSREEQAPYEAFKAGVVDRYGSYENIMNTMATDPVGFAAEVAGAKQLLTPGISKVAGAYKTARAIPVEAELAGVIKEGINKGLRPTVAGKGNLAQTEKYYNKAQGAIEAIIDNKPNLKLTDDLGNVTEGLPRNLNQLNQAIHQTKKRVFEDYTRIVRETGTDISVDLSPVVKELETLSLDKITNMYGGRAAEYAASRVEKLKGQTLTPLEAQDAIATINEGLKAFYKNPSRDTVSHAAVDALEANILRKALDDAIGASPYKSLKKSYGDLSTIEKEAAHRAIVDARKNAKGLIDFSDIYSASKMAHSIMTLNVPGAVSAAAMKGMAAWYKYTNNPNYAIQRMFIKADKLITPKPAPSPNLLSP